MHAEPPDIAAPAGRAWWQRRWVLVVALVSALVIGLIITATVLLSGDADVPDEPEPPPAASASPDVSPTPSASPNPEPEPEPEPEFDRSARSIDDPNSLWVVANKLRPLQPIDHIPADLVSANVPFTANATMREEAARALEAMFAAAHTEAGLSLASQNAYRSFVTQESVHNRLVAQLGVERARAQSAVPGHSEHQTGLSVDIMPTNGECAVEACFGEMSEGMWLAENAWRFGFHLRYPDGMTHITGYIYEPWHYRYVGTELAAELHATGTLTLEEFFGLPPAPDYAPAS